MRTNHPAIAAAPLKPPVMAPTRTASASPPQPRLPRVRRGTARARGHGAGLLQPPAGRVLGGPCPRPRATTPLRHHGRRPPGRGLCAIGPELPPGRGCRPRRVGAPARLRPPTLWRGGPPRWGVEASTHRPARLHHRLRGTTLSIPSGTDRGQGRLAPFGRVAPPHTAELSANANGKPVICRRVPEGSVPAPRTDVRGGTFTAPRPSSMGQSRRPALGTLASNPAQRQALALRPRYCCDPRY